MSEKTAKIIRNIILVIFGISFLVPFIIMITGAFIDAKIPVGSPFLWLKTHEITLNNFRHIFKYSQILRWLVNSIIISVIPTVLQMFFAAILGYVFARKDFFGKEILFWSMMAVVMVPTQVLIIPRYIMFSGFNLVNKRAALILPAVWSIMGVFLVKQFMAQLPKSLEESAKIDGASDMKIFFSIMLPLSKPVIATVGTFAFISAWNDFLTPLIFTTSSEMYPITVGLASLLTKEGNFGIEMAGALLSFIPTFLIFLFFQKYFTKGIAFTGVK
ncbi:carbohydrate ABC transporter permease [Erysipelothrix urinaevulpis]|uniref:carbohydrate ABC transporter permease n=1 Tax=Erysipelothrix urinaevulpis TaxID=2683717 RepID=UPI001358DEFF|nr:carbohydrate ABC transporter permease [Erysipelothrix urinaevulpis]